MPNRSKGGSRRQSSAQKHKVLRKIREHKRDVRKAAKVMANSGMKVRTKKSREEVKLALGVSNANPDKEKILKNLIESRAAKKEQRVERRKASREERAETEAETIAAEERGLKQKGGVEIPRDEMLTSKEVQRRDRDLERKASVEANKKAQAEFLRQTLIFAPGEDVGDQRAQLGKITSTLRTAVPCIAAIVDARAPVNTLPWDVLDDVVADAAMQAEEAPESQSPSRKRGRDDTKKPRKVNRAVAVFVTKADLVSVDALVNGITCVAEALHARYSEHAMGPSAVVIFTVVPFSTSFDFIAKHALRSLRALQEELFPGLTKEQIAAVGGNESLPNNMNGKLGVGIVGLPGVGKTAFCRHMIKSCGDSCVASVPCRSIRAIGAKRIIIPNPKNVTFVTVADNESMKRQKPICGDIIFSSWSRVEKMKEPETPAILLAEQFIDRLALCRAFSLPAAESPVGFLKSLGRCIIRDGGFQPAVAFAGGASSISSSALTASDVQGAAYATSGRRIRIRRRHEDGRNALRVGARVFLHEFVSSAHLSWCVLRSKLGGGTQGDEMSFLNIMRAFYLPKSLEKGIAGGASTSSPGALAVMAAQHAMRDFAVLMPHGVLELSPEAVTLPEMADSDVEDVNASGEEDSDVEELEEANESELEESDGDAEEDSDMGEGGESEEDEEKDDEGEE